ncbi:MAG: DegT/DnrJ/EryC1/StrS aminotransferase family protein [Pseudomonadota bacterium]
MGDFLPLARPDIAATDREAVDAVLRSGALSRGPAVQHFEASFRQILDIPHAVAVGSGTAALTLGLRALGLEPGFRCVTSPFSVPASANAALAAGATVYFVDIDPDTLAMDPQAVGAALRSGDVLMTVHAFGHPADVDALDRMARDVGAVHCEDSCEALGTNSGGRALGTVGRFGTFGFYPNKQITTGEGGMLVTADAALADGVRRLRNHGRRMDGRWFDQDAVGFNERLSDLNAALGAAQLARLDEILARRRQVAAWYEEALAQVAGLRLPSSRPGFGETALFVYVVELEASSDGRLRDRIHAALGEVGIQTGRYFAPLHLQPGLAELGYRRGAFPVAEAVANRTLALPFFGAMSRADCARVGEALRGLL